MPLVNADRLADWGGSKDSENLFPELLLRIAWASSRRRLHVDGFRTGRGIQNGGYDGYTGSEAGTDFLPSGPAGWELSTEANPRRKAQADYEARCTEPGAVNPADTTYVAVSRRRWTDRSDWEADRNNEGIWKEVRALDSTSIYQALLRAPFAHLWLSEHLQTKPEGEVTAEEWWDVYRHVGLPPLEPHNVTDNRDNEALSTYLSDRPLAVESVRAGPIAASAPASSDRDTTPSFGYTRYR
jgi:hypothetical protein